MATLIIPIDSERAAYDFQVDLDGTTYTLDFKYNGRAGLWQMEILNASGDAPIIGAVPILTNTILNYPYLGVPETPPGFFIPIDETGQNQNANRDNFGIDIKLFYEENLDGRQAFF